MKKSRIRHKFSLKFIKLFFVVLIAIIVGIKLIEFCVEGYTRFRHYQDFQQLTQLADEWLDQHQSRTPSPPVPNIVHYILFGVHQIQFGHFLSILSVLKNQRPEVIYIHCDCHQLSGQYWDRTVKVADRIKTPIVVRYVEKLEEVFGRKLNRDWQSWHSADILRIQVMKDFGGVYLDRDVYVVNPLHKYFDKELTIDFQSNGTVLGSQVIIGHKNARFLHLYLKSYKFYDQNEWYV